MTVGTTIPQFHLATVRPSRRRSASASWGFPELFVLSQAILPALLYIPGTQPLRVPIRVAAFATSLAALLWYMRTKPRPSDRNSSWKWLVVCIAYLAAMIFHPNTNSLLAGVAQVLLYLSVMAPVFWAPRLNYTSERVQRLLFIILICSGVNSMVGVLQVYDPGHWMPEELSRVVAVKPEYLDSLTYIGPDGRRIIRPPGLSDDPGAVSGPAIVAATLGLILLFSPVSNWKKAVALGAAVLGVVAIFLSQVRTSLLIAGGSLLVYVGLLVLHRQKAKAVILVSIAMLAAVASFSLAILLGGEVVQSRFSTLIESDPITVYYTAARGDQLEYGFKSLILEYPLGAGLGRWGMMRHYFGDEHNLDSPPIWAELEPNAWILDGGCVLLLFYTVALAVTTVDQLRISKFARSLRLRSSASTIVALNAGVLALIFGYTPFTTQVGMQYWFLAGVLHGAARVADR